MRVSDTENRDSFATGGKWLIAGIVLSFCVGMVFFLTLARQRSGDPIPPDAGPSLSRGDAG